MSGMPRYKRAVNALKCLVDRVGVLVVVGGRDARATLPRTVQVGLALGRGGGKVHVRVHLLDLGAVAFGVRGDLVLGIARGAQVLAQREAAKERLGRLADVARDLFARQGCGRRERKKDRDKPR